MAKDTRFVLVVEDEGPLRNLVTRILERQSYPVRGAADGQAAADLFHVDPDAVALLLTDLEMPRKNGIELIQEIRVLRPDLPVLVMSGNLDQWLGRVELSRIPFLAKPFTSEALLREVERCLKNGEVAALAS